ncbi:MAG TPA: hypothetical protein DCE47_19425 [Planctomycetaceae bacterium]|nr:hypothetical protein [Planctomycetaceae bacterium]HCD01211.1 hypothetical protein [Planctomycetaceae bacterium]
MSRMLGCLLCVAGFATTVHSQEIPGTPVTGDKPAAEEAENRSNIRVRRLPGTDDRVGRTAVIEKHVVGQKTVACIPIGVLLAPIPPSLASHLGLATGRGMMIRAVLPESPADQEQRLRRFDVILSVDGKPLTDPGLLTRTVRAAGPQKKPVRFEVIREGKPVEIEVTPIPTERDEIRMGSLVIGNSGRGDRKRRVLQIEGVTNLREIEKEIRRLAANGQQKINLRLQTTDGKNRRIRGSIRIPPNSVATGPRRATVTTSGATVPTRILNLQTRPRFRPRSRQATASSAAVVQQLTAAIRRIEILEATVRELLEEIDD